MSGILAIVGRPNVGKSALFNRIAGRRIAIVHDQPGVTRDRIAAEVEWRGVPFTLIDTGGLGLRPGEKALDVITAAAIEQVDLAIEAASAIVLVVNVQDGLVPLDQEVATRLRSAAKPVLVAINKSDNDHFAAGAVDFSVLGFDRMYPVSAIHGHGMEALMNEAVKHLRKVKDDAADDAERADFPEDEEEEELEDRGKKGSRRARAAQRKEEAIKDRALKLAIVGRPNVGKSSLINALTQSNRVVVSSVPGTTRDAVDVPFVVETEGRREHYVLVDTAGVRKQRRIDNSVEFFSVRRTEEAIQRSDITVLVLDAEEGIRDQDKKIGALITDARCACIVVVNKWDLVADSVREARMEEIRRRESRGPKTEKSRTRLTTLEEFGHWVQEKLFFLDYAPVIFTSAKSGFHLDRFLEAVRYVAAQLKQEIPTGVLNRTLHDAVTRRQPVSSRGDQLKFFYATQIGHAPPRFVLFLNRSDIFNRPYEKYLIGTLRKAFGYEGCPIQLIPRARPKTIAPVRKDQERRARQAGHRAPKRHTHGDAREAGKATAKTVGKTIAPPSPGRPKAPARPGPSRAKTGRKPAKAVRKRPGRR